MVVEVTRQVDDETWLLACLDDDMQRLNAETVVCEVRVGGQLDDRAELHVLEQTSADVVGVLRDGGCVGILDSGRRADEREADSLRDVCLDLSEFELIGAWLQPHSSDG